MIRVRGVRAYISSHMYLNRAITVYRRQNVHFGNNNNELSETKVHFAEYASAEYCTTILFYISFLLYKRFMARFKTETLHMF